MKQVVVVGAGATMAEAIPGHPKRSERPPLDGTFFELCKYSKIPRQKPIRDYVLSRFGVDPFLGGFGMEEIFNLIYTDSLQEPPPAGCLDAYWALLQMYAYAIGITTNPLSGTSQSGVGKILRDFFQEKGARELAFVTFNQDLVIEKAIESSRLLAKYSHIPWSLSECYGFPFYDVSPYSKRDQFRNVVGDPSIKIHKLHGSLNWLYHVRSRSDPKNALRMPKEPLHCINSQSVLTELRYRSAGRMIPVIPLIVPPIYEKTRFSKNLSSIWKNAAKDISDCDSLVFFGYSLPPADAWARTMLRAAIHSNKSLRAVSVIDPSAESSVRIREIVGSRSLYHHPNVAAFLGK